MIIWHHSRLNPHGLGLRDGPSSFPVPFFPISIRISSQRSQARRGNGGSQISSSWVPRQGLDNLTVWSASDRAICHVILVFSYSYCRSLKVPREKATKRHGSWGTAEVVSKSRNTQMMNIQANWPIGQIGHTKAVLIRGWQGKSKAGKAMGKVWRTDVIAWFLGSENDTDWNSDMEELMHHTPARRCTWILHTMLALSLSYLKT